MEVFIVNSILNHAHFYITSMHLYSNIFFVDSCYGGWIVAGCWSSSLHSFHLCAVRIWVNEWRSTRKKTQKETEWIVGVVCSVHTGEKKKNPTTSTEKYVITNIVWTRPREKWHSKREKNNEIKEKSAIVVHKMRASVMFQLFGLVDESNLYFSIGCHLHTPNSILYLSNFLKSNSIYFVFGIPFPTKKKKILYQVQWHQEWIHISPAKRITANLIRICKHALKVVCTKNQQWNINEKMYRTLSHHSQIKAQQQLKNQWTNQIAWLIIEQRFIREAKGRKRENEQKKHMYFCYSSKRIKIKVNLINFPVIFGVVDVFLSSYYLLCMFLFMFSVSFAGRTIQ